MDLIQLPPLTNAPGPAGTRTQPARHAQNPAPSASSEYGYDAIEVEIDQLSQPLNQDQGQHMVEVEETALQPLNVEGESELAFGQAPSPQMGPSQTEYIYEPCGEVHENRNDRDRNQDKEIGVKERPGDIAADTSQPAPSRRKRKADDSPEGQSPLKKPTRGDSVAEPGGDAEQPEPEAECDPKEAEAQGAAASPDADSSSLDDLPWWKINLAKSIKAMMKKDG